MASSGLRRRSLLAAAMTAAASRAPAAGASRFPSRAVRLVVPYSVGVGPDVVARSVAERLAPQWGQPVIVDNKPGASGIVAFGEVRHVPRRRPHAVPRRHGDAGRQPAACTPRCRTTRCAT